MKISFSLLGGIMIHCIIGTKGGVGTSSIAQALAYESAKEKKTLLLDGSIGLRSQDLLNEVEGISPYHFQDYLQDFCDWEDTLIFLKENLALVLSSPKKEYIDWDQEIFLEKMRPIVDQYDNIFVDFSSYEERDLEFWASIDAEFTFVITKEKISRRALDEIQFVFMRKKLNPKVHILMNKVKTDQEREEFLSNSPNFVYETFRYILEEEENEEIPYLKYEWIKEGKEKVSEKIEKKEKRWFSFLQGGS